jgi:hypothetical protein
MTQLAIQLPVWDNPRVVPDIELEKSLVAAFVIPRKRSRHDSLLDTRKGSDKFRRSLAHSPDWDPRFICQIENQKPQAIHEVLRKMGAPRDCYVLSENDRDDAKRMGLLEALMGAIGYGIGTVISCIPSRLAFYEGEGPGVRYILKRDPEKPRRGPLVVPSI